MRRFIIFGSVVFLTGCGATSNPKTQQDYKNNQAYCAASAASAVAGLASRNVSIPFMCLNKNNLSSNASKKKNTKKK